MIDGVDGIQGQPLEWLGWSPFFEEQRTAGEDGALVVRIASVHRARLSAISVSGPVEPELSADMRTGDFAVGDFALVDPQTHGLLRRLERRSLFQRRVAGSAAPQPVAANVDTLFVVTCCNAEFNPARLERYLALANQAGTTAVILLTKADLAEDLARYEAEARALQRDIDVVTLHPKSEEAIGALARWCGVGRTVALVGSSGVGKSTLVNTLAVARELSQETGAVREHDAKGRHTTTARSLHAMSAGGWIIDTPGMRTLQISDVADGLDTLFAEITERASSCRFSDCTHAHEPGCAVQAAVTANIIDPRRLERWRKLRGENADAARTDEKRRVSQAKGRPRPR